MRRFLVPVLAVLAIFGSRPAAAAEGPAMLELRFLSAGLAGKIAAAAVADCRDRGYKVTASVVGREGNLAALLRDPLSGVHTIEVSRMKAWTAASLQAPTSQMTARPDLSFAPGMLLIPGGLPITFGGHFYGAVAVSGADPADDERCAQAGIDAAAEILEFLD